MRRLLLMWAGVSLFGCPLLPIELQPGAEAVESTGDEPGVLRLGAWNIKKLGHGKSKDYALVASIIEEHFDVLAVIEVMQKEGRHPGLDTLLSHLGSGWQALVTDEPRPLSSSGNSEFYAILYRKGKARPCEGWGELRYHKDADGSLENAEGDFFVREPAFACFEAGWQSGAPGFDFLLAAYHATWSDGKVKKIQEEVSRISEVFASMQSARKGERDLFLIGDFNLIPQKLTEAAGIRSRTKGNGSTLSSKGEITDNLYDHLLVWDEEASGELIGDAFVLDVREKASNPKVFFQTVSDHLPIKARFQCDGPDDD